MLSTHFNYAAFQCTLNLGLNPPIYMKKIHTTFVILSLFLFLFFGVSSMIMVRNPKVSSPQITFTRSTCTEPATHIKPISENLNRLSRVYDQSFGVITSPEKNVSKTFEYKTIRIQSTRLHVLTNANIEQLKKFIDEVPQIYMDLRPDTIFAIAPEDIENPQEREHARSVPAFTSGATLYVLPNAFTADYSYFRYLFYHEWMHIIQYRKAYLELSESQLNSLGGTYIYQVNMYAPFFLDYATQSGWTKPASLDRFLAKDNESQKQSPYGKSHPVEDQAETAGYYLSGQKQTLSTNRIAWIEKFLGCL